MREAGINSLEEFLRLSIKEALCVARTGKRLAQVERDQKRTARLKIGAGIAGIAAILAIAYKLWNWSK